MGKKTKVGKDRKDKFYQLAKETGFRSRAAFKLIQLNRKFGFLQSSTVCIDLCAAPGGWMQVAKQNMPVSSIVIGVDLFPIKPVPGCIGLVEDITTDKCKQAITKELKTWKADVVLNDGAPNVGRNWLFDAYQQICLSLSAVKLATNFLKPGGWFVTKVFRSKDYNAFIWVLKQLFRKVYATKPSASRKESAEIFVVCQGYKAPDKIDPKFLDPKFVFEELDIEPKNKVNLLKEPKKGKKEKAEGYDATDVRKIFGASEFLQAENALDILQKATEIRIDDDKIANHPLTTFEIRECFKDIKVLGRKDLKEIIKWWKTMKQELYPESKPEESKEPEKAAGPLDEDDMEEVELEEIEKHIQDMKMEELREEKRKKKKANKERSKLEQKLALKMVIKGDSGPQEVVDDQIFNLRSIKNKKELESLIDQAPDISTREDEDAADEFKPKFIRYHPEDLYYEPDSMPTKGSDDSGDESDEIREDLGIQDSDEEADDNWNLRSAPKNGVGAKEQKIGDVKRNRNPLVTDLDYRDKDKKRISKAALWFEKDAFKDLEKADEKDEDIDLDTMVKNYKNKGVKIIGEDKLGASEAVLGKKAKRRAKHLESNPTAAVESSSDDDSDDENVAPEEDDTAGNDMPKVKKIKLNEEELALGQMIITSKKMRRDLADAAWNRYMFNDEGLPDWFVEDEKKTMVRENPVPTELVEKYKKNLQEFNTRSIKKVMEAKARKKRQSKKRMEKIKKKAETIMENVDNTGAEKIKLLKKLYKKAEKKKKEVTYVVAKKTGIAGKKVRRPAGVEGRFKVVDPRLKKDLRNMKGKQKRYGKKGAKKGKSMKMR